MRIVNIGAGRDGQVVIGTVARPHGIKGEIKVLPASGRPDDLKVYREVALVDPASGRTRLFDIVAASHHERTAILKLKGLLDRDGAEALRGWEVRVERRQIPALAPGDCYWHDLEGLTVVTDAGRAIGVVRDIMSTGAHDVLVVRGDRGREYLIPVADGFISHRDEAHGALVITPPPGLLEMNE